MENLRRHFAFSGQANKGPLGAERSSVFHVDVKHEVERVSSAGFSDCSEPSRPSTINSNGDMNPNGQDSAPQALAVFLQCLSRYHGAGTNLREKLNALLKGTLYEPLAAMCNTNLPANLFERRPDLVQLATEAHTLLSGMQERPPKTESSQQTVLRCMLLLLKLEAQYHEICLREVHASLRKLAQSCTTHSCHDILQLLASLGLTNLEAPNGIHSDSSGQYKTGSDQAPPLPAGCHDNLSVKDSDRSSLVSSDEIASPKLPPKQNSSKSSIFSLFGRKNSPDDGKLNGSSFYVDIKSEKPNQSSSGEFSGQELLVDTGGVLSLSVTPPPPDDFVLHNDLPLIPEKHGAQNRQKGGNGQLVSEEEIDSVINLLSGCPSGPGSNSSSRTSPQMQSIPENKVPSSHLDRPREQLSVPMPTGPAHRSPSPVHRTPSPAPSPAPVITNIPITVTHENDSLKPPQRTQLHRRSEGSIDFASGTMGRNTWPHQHRPGGLPNAPPPNGFYDPLSQDHLFGRRFSSEFQTRPRGYYGGHLLSNTSWLFPESRLQHTWNTLSSHTSSQASGLATAGSDTMASSNWSGFQDSSDLSDDSSSGDQFFAVGLDLVNALDSKNDSSDDECDRGFFNGAKDQRPRSMENLLDVKSNHTWPPKQPWARSALVISEAMEQSAMDNLHRPLQMQWSDPMSSRNVWGAAGLGPQLSHRSMHDFGHLPH